MQIPSLSNYFITTGYKGNCEFTHEYMNIVKNYWTNKSSNMENPGKLLDIFKKYYKHFDNSQQHDAQEVMVNILDLLHKGTKTREIINPRMVKNNEWDLKSKSLIKELFVGQIEKKIIYPQGESVTRENCTHLMFTPLRHTTLEELMEEMHKDEVIEGYQDHSGKTHRVAVMKHQFINRPSVLIMCFNMFVKKVNVKLPVIWEDYKLIACCLHMGSTRSGHYVAFTLHKGKWYLKDDESVREMNPNLNNQYYFCVYKKLTRI